MTRWQQIVWLFKLARQCLEVVEFKQVGLDLLVTDILPKMVPWTRTAKSIGSAGALPSNVRNTFRNVLADSISALLGILVAMVALDPSSSDEHDTFGMLVLAKGAGETFRQSLLLSDRGTLILMKRPIDAEFPLVGQLALGFQIRPIKNEQRNADGAGDS